jgi:hypothetical protein
MQMAIEESAEVPSIIPRLCELIVVVGFLTKQSLAMHWNAFLSGEPVRADHEAMIWSRLNQIRVAIGDRDFERAAKVACAEFSAVLESHTGGETARALWTIFSCGDSAQRHAAGFLMQQYTGANNRSYRDKRLREILSRVRQRDEDEVPREIQAQIERVKGMSRALEVQSILASGTA